MCSSDNVINKDIFKKYGEFSIDKIKEPVDFSFIDKLVEQQRRDIDNMCYEFLTKNGYKIDKPYKEKQLKEIAKDLESKDLFLDFLAYNRISEDNSKVIYNFIPFFNRISNPLSLKDREEIIERWKKINEK